MPSDVQCFVLAVRVLCLPSYHLSTNTEKTGPDFHFSINSISQCRSLYYYITISLLHIIIIERLFCKKKHTHTKDLISQESNFVRRDSEYL